METSGAQEPNVERSLNANELELGSYELDLITDLDRGLVGWDSADDSANPMNFSPVSKWTAIGVLSLCTFVSPLASSMFSPAVGIVMNDFNTNSSTLGSLTVSIYVLGYAVGPLLWSPWSEIYGRVVITHISNVIFTAFQLACARSQSISTLILFRFIAGFGGSSPLTIGAAIISDVIPPQNRGLAMAIYSAGPLLGPVIGPICGGFITEELGWPYVFYILLAITAISTLLALAFLRETYAPVILQKRTNSMRRELKRADLKCAYDRGLKSSQILAQAMIRPGKLLIRSMIVLAISTYVAFAYGLLYLLFVTIPEVFMEQYRFTLGKSGLAFLGVGTGFVLGIIFCGRFSDAWYNQMVRNNAGISKPEYRLPPLMVGSIFLPVGLFWYGWSIYNHEHWVVAILGNVPFGFGLMIAFHSTSTYLIETFSMYAASVIAAVTVLRSLFGAFLPLAGPEMYAHLGIAQGNSVLGGIATAMIAIPILFYRYGEIIRLKYPVEL